MRFASIQCSKMRLRSLQCSPHPLASFKGAAAGRRGRGGKGKGGKGGEERDREVGQGEGRGGEVNSDARLEQGSRLAKAGPANAYRECDTIGRQNSLSERLLLSASIRRRMDMCSFPCVRHENKLVGDIQRFSRRASIR